MGLLSPQISLKKVVPLCRQLATSFDAGLPILRSLELVSGNHTDRRVREVITRIHDDIKGGATLGEAARAQQRYLPSFFVEMLATGEKGGKLEVMLRDVADYFEDRLDMRRKIIGALIYPIILLTAAWFLGTFAFGMINRVLSIFSNPRASFSFSDYLTSYAWFQAASMLVAAAIVAVCIVLARLGLFGYVWGLFATHIWPMSTVTRKFGLARFFRSMSLLISSGLRIDHCIKNSAAVVANPYIERDLLKAVPLVKEGTTLVEAFATSRMLTPTSREMINIGEQSGQLEMALRKVSEYHLAEATHAVNVASKILYYVIYLAVAAFVGYIIISFYAKFYGGVMNELGI
jgi:type IV pilus assembly protein PilC